MQAYYFRLSLRPILREDIVASIAESDHAVAVFSVSHLHAPDSTLRIRNLLYVACTRAKHELALTHVGPVSRLLRAW